MDKGEEKRHILNVIKCEEEGNLLIWKHPVEDFNIGAQLIVHESQQAIFLKNGQALDTFGPGRWTLDAQRLPLLGKLVDLVSGNVSMFHCEVYFINLTTRTQIKWGTDSKVRLFDPASGMSVELGASGEFSIRVIDARKLLFKLVGTSGGISANELTDTGDGRGYFRVMIITQVKSFLAQTIREQSIDILQIDERLLELSEALRNKINLSLEQYGLLMPEFFVARIQTPDDDPDFIRLKKQFGERTVMMREEHNRQDVAQAAAGRKLVEAQTAAQLDLIKAQTAAESLRLKAQAEAQEMQMKGYTYQQETARTVGLAAMQNGLTGGAGGGAAGDIASLGITLGAMGSIAGITKDALNPAWSAMQNGGTPAPGAAPVPIPGIVPGTVPGMAGSAGLAGTAVPAAASAAGWDCPQCGAKNITSRFCPDCGAPKPAPAQPESWDCPQCGMKNITSRFCPNCGTPKPAPAQPAGWTCPNCGNTGITSGFCPQCGTKKP